MLSVSDLAGVFDPTSGRLADGTTFSGFEAYALVARDQIADDRWTGAGGDDFMRSAGGNDVLVGGGGNDELDAGVGSDVVDGGDGNDKILVGAEGRDYVVAGAGIDTVEIDRNTSQDGLVFYVSQNIGRLNDGTVIVDAEHFRIRSGAGNDLLKAGTALSVDFSGGDGNDRLTGGKGHDTLDGGAGNDVLLGRDGNDRIKDYGEVGTVDAGSGNDAVDVFAGSGNTLNPGLPGAVSGLISIQLGSGNDVVGLNRRESSKEKSA
ncbi:calcium-binding protein, partial [Rhizobiaceae sp. 2RAB30]